MADSVYRVFTSENLYSTTIQTEPTVIVWSGSDGYDGMTHPTASLSLYGGVRSRSDVGPESTSGMKIYPLVDMGTNSVDGVVQVPSPYPHSGSVRFFYCRNIPQDAFAGRVATDELWYEEHHSTVRRLSDWYNKHVKCTYQSEDKFPSTITGWHVPQMFYHRQIATGSVLLTVNAFINGTWYPSQNALYWVDDGYGRLWSVASSTSSWTEKGATQVSGTVLYNEGIIVFTHPDPAWHLQLKLGEGTEPHIKLQFRSVNPIKTMMMMCRMAPGDVNASSNPTYYVTGSHGERWAWDKDTSNEATTYISAIGLYNDERQLIGVAKLAQPIRKREKDSLDIKLRLDV